MMNNDKLKKAKIYKENDQYYFNLTYEYEDEKGIHERTIPKIRFPYTLIHIPFINSHISVCEDCRRYIDIDDELEVLDTNEYIDGTKCTGIYSIDKLIKPKVHEMTLEEIEKKLGYSVKIVSK